MLLTLFDFLMGVEIKELKVRYLKKDKLLHNVVIQLSSKECTAIGIMNRNNGVTEEIIEYMTAENKYVVENFVSQLNTTIKIKIYVNLGIGNQHYTNGDFTKL